MRRIRTLVGVCGFYAMLVLTLAPAAAAQGNGHDDDSSAKLLLSDLSSPKGLAVNKDRNLVVGQGAFGAPGPVLEYDIRGRDKGKTTPLTEPANLVDVAVSPKDGTGWGITGPIPPEGDPAPPPGAIPRGHLLHQLRDGTVVDVLDITAYQAGDPDPVDQDRPPNPTESNPYGLTVDRKGNALVADAAGNDIIRVSPDGKAETVARFDVQAVSTADVPPGIPGIPYPLPPTITAEAVPTTVTIGPDGAIYVGELKGFPFKTGTSNIWRIDSRAVNASCSANTPDPTKKCSLYQTGYTAIQDIAFGSGKTLYVYELAAEGVFAFEAGLSTGQFPDAVLLQSPKRDNTERKELAAGQLSQPGAVVVVNDDVYVTDSIFTGGRLLKIDDGGREWWGGSSTPQ
jgi:hypothetical protein